jgi:hypothetical protein
MNTPTCSITWSTCSSPGWNLSHHRCGRGQVHSGDHECAVCAEVRRSAQRSAPRHLRSRARVAMGVKWFAARAAVTMWLAVMFWVVIDCPVAFFLDVPGQYGVGPG